MKTCFLLLLAQSLVFVGISQNNAVPKDIQVKLAVLAAPMELRDSATVMAVDAKGETVVLRQGTNQMICLADDPAQKGFSVSCYHRDVEPFMQRGRELRKMGKSFKEISDMREEEAKTGKLVMNKEPSTLYVYTAKPEDYDSIAGTVQNGYLRYVVYIPWATSKTTGLPTKPDVPGMPWIMDPGTHKAHIMISPPQKQ